MKIEEVDPLLTALSEEYGVPKPNYCIFQVSALKKLDPLFSDPKYGVTITRGGGGSWDTLPMGASFHPDDKYGYITLLVRKKGQVSRESIVHEFFHYLHWVQGKYKITTKLKMRDLYEFFWKLVNGKQIEDTLEEVTKYFAERYEEERITKRETRKWLREHPLPKKMFFNISVECSSCGGDILASIYWDEMKKKAWAVCPKCKSTVREWNESEWNEFL